MGRTYTPLSGEAQISAVSVDNRAETESNTAKYLGKARANPNSLIMDERFVYSDSGRAYRRIRPRSRQHVLEPRLPYVKRMTAKGHLYHYFEHPGRTMRVRLPDISDPGFGHAYRCQLARLEGNDEPSYIQGDRSAVYFVGGDIGAIKIGISIDLPKRLASLNSHSPIPLKALATVRGGRKEEKAYHRRFAAHRLHGEWFSPAPEILAEIERLKPHPHPERGEG